MSLIDWRFQSINLADLYIIDHLSICLLCTKYLLCWLRRRWRKEAWVRHTTRRHAHRWRAEACGRRTRSTLATLSWSSRRWWHAHVARWRHEARRWRSREASWRRRSERRHEAGRRQHAGAARRPSVRVVEDRRCREDRRTSKAMVPHLRNLGLELLVVGAYSQLHRVHTHDHDHDMIGWLDARSLPPIDLSRTYLVSPAIVVRLSN